MRGKEHYIAFPKESILEKSQGRNQNVKELLKHIQRKT